MSVKLEPCCGWETNANSRDEQIYLCEGKALIRNGIHRGFNDFIQCLEDVFTGERFDVLWSLFVDEFRSKEIRTLNEMELIAFAASEPSRYS